MSLGREYGQPEKALTGPLPSTAILAICLAATRSCRSSNGFVLSRPFALIQAPNWLFEVCRTRPSVRALPYLMIAAMASSRPSCSLARPLGQEIQAVVRSQPIRNRWRLQELGPKLGPNKQMPEVIVKYQRDNAYHWRRGGMRPVLA
jgi:hypothetical protein